MKMTRERYLLDYTIALRDGVFKQAGIKVDLKKIRVVCGFPSTGARARKNKRIGECWASSQSAGKLNEIMIHPELIDPIKVGDVLIHEMVHAVDDCKHGHKKEFRRMAIAVGLTGKMTATVPSDELIVKLKKIVKKLGKYPHMKLDATARKKQSTRMIKLVCNHIDDPDPYIVRISRKQAERGTPICPVCYESSCGDEIMFMEVE